MKKAELLELVRKFEEEDRDLSLGVTARTKKAEVVAILAEFMGLSEEQEQVVEESIENNVVKEIESEEDVQSLLSELGLEDGPEEVELPPEETKEEKVEEKAEVEPKEEKKVVKAEKKASENKTRIPIDAPIPVREWRGLTLGVYGNILEKLEEPDENGYEWYKITFERFNTRAHEQFRETNGNMSLYYRRGGGRYLIVFESPDGTIEPVLEVTNRGRGHLRCRQYANALLLAHDEKRDYKYLEAEEYDKLASQIELWEIKLPEKVTQVD